MMICLLRSLKLVPEPSTGWDRLPPDSDNSLGANLTRIKVYRNKLSHPSKCRLNDNSFHKIWSSLKVALSEISEGESDAIVRDIETFDFERSNKEELLCRIQQEVQEMKNELQFHCNLKENTKNLVEEWRGETQMFYKTRGTEEVLKKIQTNNAIMIIGNSGTGKSATLKYVSLKLEKEGYEIIPVNFPSDIPYQRFSSRKQLFIIDDIIGKYRVDNVALESWQRINNRLELIFKDKNAKLLCTLRRQLQKDISDVSVSTVFNSTVVDLDSNDLALSHIEKKGMFRNYMLHRNKQDDIDTDEIERICHCTNAFPLLCDSFFSNPEFFKRKAKFFSNPSTIFREELDRLQKKNKKVYCVLVLNMIFELENLQNIFDITCELQRKDDFLLILRACEVPESIPRKRLYQHLLSVSGSFVQSENPFTFIHDRLEETIACHFGSCFPEIMLHCCKREYLRERVRLQKSDEDDENVLILKRSSYDAFSKRILTEILNGKFRDVLLSEPLQNREYVNYFLSYLEKNKLSLQTLEQVPCTDTLIPTLQQEENKIRNITNTNRLAMLEVLQDQKSIFIHWLIATGCYFLFCHIYKRPKSSVRRLYEKYTLARVNDLLHLAVLGENLDIITFLLRKGGNVKSCDTYGIPLLCKVAKTNHCDVANVLIEEGADVNQKDEVLGWTACFVAAWFNEVEMLDLLLNRGSDANYFDSQLRTPLAIAVIRNNVNAVSVLLRYGAYIYDKVFHITLPINSRAALQEALLNKNSKIVQMLLSSGRARNELGIQFPVSAFFENNSVVNDLLGLFLNDLKQVSSGSSLWRGFFEICTAIYKNDTNMIHKVFNEKGKGMYRIRFRGEYIIEARKYLLANFNGNYLRLSLLHIAAVCDAVNAAKILMGFGANPFQRDIKDRTPLHLAHSEKMIETLLNSNFEQFHEEKLTPFPSLKKILLLFVSFKLVPAAARILVSSRNGVNTTDSNGNTPLHSMIMRMTNVTRCLDAVESLIRHGADPRIRCHGGYLPLDHFRTLSLSMVECEVERGEKILGCPKTRSFIKKETCYLMTWSFLFISFMLWFYFFIVGNACIDMGFSVKSESNSVVNGSQLLHFRSLFYIHIISVLLLNRLALLSCGWVKSFMFREMEKNLYTQ